MSTEFLLSDLAAQCGGEIKGDPNTVIRSIAPISTANEGQISFLEQLKYRKYLEATRASALILARKDAAIWEGNAILVDHPAFAYTKIAALFDKTPKTKSGVHASVVMGEGCEIHSSASIAAHVVLGDRVKIGAHVVIGPNTSISDRVSIGEKTKISANVSIYHDVQIGARVHIDSAAVIGAEGFGLVKVGADWIKIPQIGSVIIEDDVSIGAGTTVDRGAIENTILKKGTKLDNLVMVAHNVQIGPYTAIAACTGISGSTKIGAHCMIGGASNISDHVEITDQVILTGATSVHTSLKKPGVYSSGTPATEHMTWKRAIYRLLKLEALFQRVERLERTIETKENS